MRLAFLLLALFAPCLSAFGQKMLLLERANRARTVKFYVGHTLHFRLVGEEDYWYQRSITDILPESNTLLLDNFPVKVSDIAALRVHRDPTYRIFGASFATFGATLALAATVGRFGYNDRDLQLGKLYGTAAASGAAGWFLLKKRTLRMGDTHRLRPIEIKMWRPK
jgi:hypothetical protein